MSVKIDPIKLLNLVRQDLGDEWETRIPEATRANIAEVGNFILELPTDRKNEYYQNLINKIGMTLVASPETQNKFEVFRKDSIEYGDTIEDIFVGIPKGENFPKELLVDGQSIDPFKITKAQLEVLYHTVDREMVYPVTLHDAMVKRAFKSPQDFTRLVESVRSSLDKAVTDDHFTFGKQLVSLAKIHGHTVELGADTEQVIATNTLRAIRKSVSELPYMRNDRNALKVRNNTPVDNIVVIMREDVKLAIDMDVLAGIFNLDKVEMQNRLITVDNFNEDADLLAVVMDDSGLQIRNALKTTESIRNPKGLYTNVFVHSWDLYSFSAYANCVAIRGTVLEGGEAPDPIVIEFVGQSDYTMNAGDLKTLTDNVARVKKGETFIDDVLDETGYLIVVPDMFTFSSTVIERPSGFIDTTGWSSEATVKLVITFV